MKKRLSTFFALLATLLMLAPSLWADTGTVSAPSGESSDYIPFGLFQSKDQSESLYSPTQLAAATNNVASFKITELHYQFAPLAGRNDTGAWWEKNFETTLEVYAKVLDSQYDLTKGMAFTDMMPVYSAKYTVKSGDTTMDLTLTTPIEVKAGQYLLIGCYNAGGTSAGNAFKFKSGQTDLTGKTGIYSIPGGNWFNPTPPDITTATTYGSCAALDITYEPAAAPTPAVPDNLFKDYTYTPTQEAVQNGLRNITVTFPNAETIELDEYNFNITGPNDEDLYDDYYVSCEGNVITLETTSSFKTPGTYTLNLKRSALTATYSGGNEALNDEDIDITWTIAKSFDPATLFEGYTYSPSEEDAQSAGLKNISVTFPKASMLSFEENLISFKDETGSYELYIEKSGTTLNIENVESACKAPGKYTLTFAAGALTGYDSAGNSGSNANPIIITWTIEEPPFDTTKLFKDYTFTPSVADAQAGIETITVTFPNALSVKAAPGGYIEFANSNNRTWEFGDSNDGNTIQLDLTAKVVTPDTYTLLFAPNSLMASYAEGVYMTNEDAIVISWTIDKPAFDVTTLFKDWTKTPAEAVAKLETATVTFPNCKEVALDPSNSGLTITDASGNAVNNVSFGYEDNQVKVSFDDPITTSGTYTLTIPANKLTGYYDGGNAKNTEAITVSWDVTFDVATVFAGYTYTPSAEDAKAGIEKITVTFPNFTAPLDNGVNNAKINLKDAQGNVVNCTKRVEGNVMTITPNDKITTPDTYTLTIDAQALTVMYKETPESSSFKPASNPEAISISWTVEKQEAPIDQAVLFAYTSNPAEGIVEKISQTFITFPNATEVTIVEGRGEDINVLCPDGSSVTAGAYTWENQLVMYPFESLTAKGEYTLEVKAGSIQATNAEGQTATNAETLNLKWEVGTPIDQDTHFAFTSTPEAGSYNEAMLGSSKYVTFNFATGAELEVVENTGIGVYWPDGSFHKDIKKVNNTIRIFSPFANDGEYKCVINPGALKLTLNGQSAVNAKELSFIFYIGQAPVDPSTLFTDYSVTPENNTDVEKLESITVTFPNLSSVDTADETKITFVNESGAPVSGFFKGYANPNQYNLVTGEAVTAPGKYTLTFAVGALKTLNGSETVTNPEAIEFSWTIPAPVDPNTPLTGTVVEVGSYDTYEIPINTNYCDYSASESLYSAEMLGAATENSDEYYITALNYKLKSNTVEGGEFMLDVFMAKSDKNDLTTGVAEADMTKVFHGVKSFEGTSDFTIKLDTPFAMKAGESLVIGITNQNLEKKYALFYEGNKGAGEKRVRYTSGSNPISLTPDFGNIYEYNLPALDIEYTLTAGGDVPEPDVFDLAAESIVAPATVVAGQTYDFEVKVRNAGNVNVTDFAVNVYTTSDSGRTDIGYITVEETLEPGQSTTVKVSCKLENAGTFEVGANVFNEDDSNYDNDNTPETISVKAVKLDVTAASLEAPATAELDEAVTLKLTVKNAGDAANSDYSVKIVSVDADGNVLRTLATMDEAPEVAANSEKTIEIPYTFDLGGNYLLKGVVCVEGFDDTLTLPAQVDVTFDRLSGTLDLTTPAAADGYPEFHYPISRNANKSISQVLYTPNYFGKVARNAEIQKLGFTMAAKDTPYTVSIPVKIQVASVADVTALGNSASALVPESEFTTVFDNVVKFQEKNENSTVMFELQRPFVLKEGESLVVMVTSEGEQNSYSPDFLMSKANNGEAEYVSTVYVNSNAADTSALTLYSASSVQTAKQLPVLSLEYALEPLRPVVDLKVNSLLAKPTEPTAGEEVTFSAEIENVGTVAVDSFKLELVDVTDAENPEVLASKDVEDAYGAGAVVTEKVKYTFETAGEYKVEVRVVVADDVDETNNTSAVVDVTVAAPLAADLVAKSLTASVDEAQVNTDVTFAAAVENKGNAAADAFKVELLDMTNEQAPEVLASTDVTTPLAAGDSQNYDLSYQFATEGEYKVAVRVVYDDDADDTNNLSQTITVKVVNNSEGIFAVYNAEGLAYGNGQLVLPEGAAAVVVADAAGRVVANKAVSANIVDLRLDAGVYFVSVQLSNGSVSTARILVK